MKELNELKRAITIVLLNKQNDLEIEMEKRKKTPLKELEEEHKKTGETLDRIRSILTRLDDEELVEKES